MSYESRFWSKVDKNGECWEWTAAKTKGYGVLRVDHSNVYAHRIAWQLENGAIPNGMVVMHKCDNPGCVRHTHLRVGTQAENILDMKLKGRDNDDNFWYAKRTISNEIVSQIQEIGFSKSNRQMSKMFGIERSYVSRLRSKTRRATP